ncbi:MAG: hypothetical protein ACI8W8_002517, partial [Rhodothermales bacterium]
MKHFIACLLATILIPAVWSQSPIPPQPKPPAETAKPDPLVELTERQAKLTEEVAAIEKRLAAPDLPEAAMTENKNLRDGLQRVGLILAQHISALQRERDLKVQIAEENLRLQTITETGLDSSP